jgi:hypothetical protein
MTHGGTSQPHSFGYGSGAAYTLYLDNGGISGTGYLSCNVHPATLRSILHRCTGRFSPSPALCTACAVYTRPLHSLYFIFYWLDYIMKILFVKYEKPNVRPQFAARFLRLAAASSFRVRVYMPGFVQPCGERFCESKSEHWKPCGG